MTNYFDELSKVDCSKHVEKKGNFSYLSWPFAVAELKKKHPSATWEVKKDANGAPYTATSAGCFVEVEVNIEGVKLSQIHPVLDNRNKTIATPDAFQVNTSIQRCLVKAIALHGLGLYIYAGEDLPIVDEKEEYSKLVAEHQETISTIKASLAEGDYSTAKEAWQETTQDIQIALWKAPTKGGCFTTKERTQMKSTEWSEAQ